MTDIYSVRHEEQRAIKNADQVEVRAIRSGSAVLDFGVYDERLSGETDDLNTGVVDGELWHKQDVALDDEVGPIREEIDRRILLMGESYPFSLNGNNLVYKKSNHLFYEYCLGICTAPNITSRPFVQLPRSFERVTAVLVKLNMGLHADSLHTGTPRSFSTGFTFVAAMKKLSELSTSGREWRFDPEPGYPAAPSRTGDEGVDFVVWKRALDNRIGQLFILGQCACGNDWGTKFSDLRLERLQPWFRPMARVEPIRCFATPFMVSDGNFLVAHRDAGWTLDRARLVMMASAQADQEEYQSWIPILNQMIELSREAA